MNTESPHRYKAFLSYAHADGQKARWLHAQLESYAIDADLVGRETRFGAVPKSLRPIFRDRDDFTGGELLSEATTSAIDQSAALIVVCSPTAAERPAVNEEIRLFRWRHPERPVIPVIVAGTYPDNFPPALRFEIDADGTISNRSQTILAADTRDSGDGEDTAVAKIVAGLIGVPADDVRKRQLIAAKKRMFRKALISTSFAVLGLVAVGLGVTARISYQALGEAQRERAELAQRLTLISSAEASPAQQQALTGAVTDIVKQAEAGDPRFQQAFDLLKAEKVDEAVAILKTVAEEKGRQAASDPKAAVAAAAAYRNLGAIAGLADQKTARDAYARALSYAPDDAESLYWQGYLQLLADDYGAAETSLRKLLVIAHGARDAQSAYRARLRLGEILYRRGDLKAARGEQQQALNISLEELAKRPGDVTWRRYRAEAEVKAGDVERDLNRLSAALANYRQALFIGNQLALLLPGDVGVRRELTVALDRVADVQSRLGNHEAALKTYRDALAISKGLLAEMPNHARMRRDVSISFNKIGNELSAMGEQEQALASYREALAIREQIAAADPRNAGARFDLCTSHEYIGDQLLKMGDRSAAAASYDAMLSLREQLAREAPDDERRQRALAVAYEKVGRFKEEAGDWQGALAEYRQVLAVREKLVEVFPDNPALQGELAVVYNRIGDTLRVHEDMPGALANYRLALALRERVVQQADANAPQPLRDLSQAQERIAYALAASEDHAGALAFYQAALATRDKVAALSGVEAQQDEVRILKWVALTAAKAGDPNAARAAIGRGRDITRRLLEKTPDDATLQSDLQWFEQQNGEGQ